MSNYILALVLLILTFAGIVVRKTYFQVPVHELKRRARNGDKFAAQLYRAVAYGGSLRALLWLYIGLAAAGSLVVLARLLPIWVSLLIVGPLLWIGFSLMPASRVTRVGRRLTIIVTPLIARLLNYVHPLLSRANTMAAHRYVLPEHTQLFERDDLVALIEQQQHQQDNRLSEDELEIAKRALQFGDHKVRDILTPRKAVKTVSAGDTVGPVLIDEFHKTGQEYMLVREQPKGPFVGTLAFRRLGIESTGQVRDLMDGTVYYLHEDDNLSSALHAFFTTNHSIFVVVNSFEEHVGIVTIENILHQLLGHVPGDEFDQYTDIAAVAARHNALPKAETAVEELEPEPKPKKAKAKKPTKNTEEVVE